MVGMIFLGLAIITIAHEEAHVVIYKGYGINSHVEYFQNGDIAVTISERNCPNDSCTLAHNINEIVGYTLEAFFVCISIMIVLFRLSLEDKK